MKFKFLTLKLARYLFTLFVLVMISRNNHWSTTLGFFLVFFMLEFNTALLYGLLEDVLKLIKLSKK